METNTMKSALRQGVGRTVVSDVVAHASRPYSGACAHTTLSTRSPRPVV